MDRSSTPERGVPASVRRWADRLLVLVVVSIPLSTTGMQAGVLGLGGLSAAAWIAPWGIVRRTPLDGSLMLLFGVLAVTTLASGAALEAGGWRRPWVVLSYFVVYWWLRDRTHAARLVRLLVGAGGLAATYAIVQHFTGIDWYRELLGRPTMVRPREPGLSGYPSVGFFRNYLTFGHAMLVPLSCAGALALRRAPVGLVAAPLLLVAIVFSTARGAWLAVPPIAVALGVLAGGRRAGMTLVGLGTVAALVFVLAPDLRGHAAQMFGSDGANAGRIGIYRANLDIVHEHPILGLGFGRYRTAARPYYRAHPTADRRSHAHSNYLHIAAESGLVGLAAFMLLWAAVLRAGWPAVARAPSADVWAAAAGTWAATVGFLVGGLTQYTFGDNECALGIWVAIAVLMRCRD